MSYQEALKKLEQNPSEVYEETIRILFKIVDNILNNPTDLKIRSLQKSNLTISNKILKVPGGPECLKLVGFDEKENTFVMDMNASLKNLLEFKQAISSWRKLLEQKAQSRAHSTSQKSKESQTSEILQPPSTSSVGIPRLPQTHATSQKSNQSQQSESSSSPRTSNIGIPKIPETRSTSQKPNQNQKTETSPSPRAHSVGTSKLPQKIIKKIKLPRLVLTHTIPLLRRMETYAHEVLQYEDADLLERTRNYIPVATLEENAQNRLRLIQRHIKKNKLEDPDLSTQDMLILELLTWFKEDFFDWVNSPTCSYCGGTTEMSHMSTDPNLDPYTDRVELHRCKSCQKFTPFPRYNDLNILLETRRGRCGEWANTFTLCCRAMGWDARFVVDEEDHVWTEVYSVTQKRWLHCDPCENICDTPLIYESGWKKKISYILAYSAEDVQDVTWRYSSNHKEVLKRRKQCSEQQLLDAILIIRRNKQKDLTQSRKRYLVKRTLHELVDFLLEKKVKESELKGRSSGSEVWRLARGELHEDDTPEVGHTWIIKESDIVGNTVNIRYSSALNKYEYISGGRKLKEISGWSRGTFSNSSIFRKEEKDWKMTYLARREGDKIGRITWAIDLNGSNRKLDTVDMKFGHQTYETGVVDTIICSSNACVPLYNGQKSIVTKEFANNTILKVKTKLSGGKGITAWQHAQLFRQSLDSNDYTFSITLTFQ